MSEVTSNRPNHRPIRVVVVGSHPPPIGGATISLKWLVEELRRSDGASVRVIDTAGIRRAGILGLGRAFLRLAELFWRTAGSDVVSVHISPSALAESGLLSWAAARCFGKPFIVRLFGGTEYGAQNGTLRRALGEFVVRHADAVMVETRSLVRSAQDAGLSQAKFFSNSRPLSTAYRVAVKSSGCRRFVYVSHIKLCKGVNEIIEAAERFDEGITVDVYGPFYDGLSPATFSNLKRVRYCGIVQPEDLAQLLCRYDVLLFPTYHPGEGYAGIILEAYNVGLPVICTEWKALPEIVDHDSGLMIPPRNADALHVAMKKLIDDPRLCSALAQGAFEKRQLFDATYWTERFLDVCRQVSN